MAKKVLRLAPGHNFFLSGGLHLHPYQREVVLPDDYVPPKEVRVAIKAGTLIDVNGNVLTGEQKVQEEAVPQETVKEEATKDETAEEAEKGKKKKGK